MRTQRTIILIVLVAFLSGMGIAGLSIWRLGFATGILVLLLAAVALVGLYFGMVRPWLLQWGATDAEATMRMPGDELIPGAGQATRAITIEASPQEIWPWLVQLGFGKAGWYSYDWIDNDGKPSADRILPEHQELNVGDKILMMPTMGFVVNSVVEPQSIVSVLEDGSTSWCLGLYPADGGGTRLLSRWRPKFDVTPATVLMIALTEPGSFIMGQKMLRGIRDRVEQKVASPRT